MKKQSGDERRFHILHHTWQPFPEQTRVSRDMKLHLTPLHKKGTNATKIHILDM